MATGGTMNEKKVLKPDQIKSNPNNPRIIKDDRFQKLVQSLKDFPEMADVREVVVNKDHMILGGNMRFRAMIEAGWKEIPVVIVDWSEEKQREFIIKDNVSGGEWDWDMLANEWDQTDLDLWGLDLIHKPDSDTEKADQEYSEQYQVVVECTSEEDQERTYNKLKELGYECKVLTL